MLSPAVVPVWCFFALRFWRPSWPSSAFSCEFLFGDILLVVLKPAIVVWSFEEGSLIVCDLIVMQTCLARFQREKCPRVEINRALPSYGNALATWVYDSDPVDCGEPNRRYDRCSTRLKGRFGIAGWLTIRRRDE